MWHHRDRLGNHEKSDSNSKRLDIVSRAIQGSRRLCRQRFGPGKAGTLPAPQSENYHFGRFISESRDSRRVASGPNRASDLGCYRDRALTTHALRQIGH